MNIERYLILDKGEDKTEDIEQCDYRNSKWQVVYKNNSKVYEYSYSSIDKLKVQRILSPENCAVYQINQPISGIDKIIDFGNYIKILFKNGYKKVYSRSSITIEETCLTNKDAYNCFGYIKKLAECIGIKFEDDTNFLIKQLNRISMISPRSVLALYLEKKALNSRNFVELPIFPFGFNLSQKEATRKALSEQLSVIEGPPGTGKTQTILNIIANAIINNKTVAVVSNNNSATANVIEKLQKYGVGFIAAYLGNRENKEKFFAEQKSTYPDLEQWGLEAKDNQLIKAKLTGQKEKLNELLEYKNQLASLKTELSSLLTEQEYFDKYYVDTNGKPLKLHSILKINADKVMSLLVDYQFMSKTGKIPIWGKVINLIRYGIFNFSIYENDPEIIISFLQKTYYERKSKDINNRIESLTKKLESFNFENSLKEYSETSMILFKAKLAEKYGISKDRTVFSEDVLWKNFGSFATEFPVVLSTTHSLRSCIGENYLFDYVIIDEASQVDIVTGALALSCAQKAVIVGDIKQLPNVVPTDIAKKTKQVFDSFKLDKAYSYAENSLLSSIVKLYPEVPKTLLREHYRCHPKIIGFCNQKFYNNELIILTDEQEFDKPLVLYKTAKGNHARGKFNQRQIDVIFEEIIPEQRINEKNESVGIISPYRLQTNELHKAIGFRNIEADTVHKYQGREKDVIILTTVENEIEVNDFVDDPNLINVAVSRAVNKLIVVASEGCEEFYGTNIGDLVRYIKYNNFEIIQSQIYSVFDLLYKSYSKKLNEYLKKRKNASEHISEVLMNVVIENVLSEPAFQNLDKIMHQPLKMLIKDPSKLNDDECRFAMNVLTHTDFIIFNKLDKMPVLVVEVDGYAFHANNAKQIERDKMKDAILQKYGIPIIRIKTNESGEENKLRQKLAEIMKLKN